MAIHTLTIDELKQRPVRSLSLPGMGWGDLVVVTGRPASGKTTWALQCAWHWARNRHPVGFFSPEEQGDTLVRKMMAYALERGCPCSGLDFIESADMTLEEIAETTSKREYHVIFVDCVRFHAPCGLGSEYRLANAIDALNRMAQLTGTLVIAII